MVRNHEPVPAIVRDLTEQDKPAHVKYDMENKIIAQPRDTVTFSRGFGDSGYRVQVVEHECPNCQFDRMIRRIDVSPERRNEVRYWCLFPNCVHYASDHLSHDCHGNYPQHDTNEPEVIGE